MKLLYCAECCDMVKLISTLRSCRCGKTSGILKDKMIATINGPARVIGIADNSFFKAIGANKQAGSGVEFKAFVMPHENKSVIHMGQSNIKQAKQSSERHQKIGHVKVGSALSNTFLAKKGVEVLTKEDEADVLNNLHLNIDLDAED